ncbi:MAG: UDP-N-acetylmuramate--L-alanine ligase, partial [Deltaproteobacteria bacterium]
MIPEVKKRLITYGLTSQADFQASEIEHQADRTSFLVSYRGEALGQLSIRMPGRHNVLNALAAVAVGMELDMPFDSIAEGFHDFGGVQRRFQVKGEAQGIMVVDDYGHHPVEIKATLAAARSGWDRRVVAVFQPHRYSRTEALFDDFLTAFYQADHVAVMDVYAAGEEPRPEVSAEKLAEGISGHGHKSCCYTGNTAATVEHLQAILQPGDIVITLGAGNVYQVGDDLLQLLENEG